MGRRLLIIDDNHDICESLRDRLEMMGYTVFVAHDGNTGLAMLALEERPTPISGVLLDVHMPVMDGFEVLRELRSRHKDLPVVIMSASGGNETQQQALSIGANHYVVKPFDGNTLKRICETLFPLGTDRALPVA